MEEKEKRICKHCGRKILKEKKVPQYKWPTLKQKKLLFEIAEGCRSMDSKHPGEIGWSYVEILLLASPELMDLLDLKPGKFNSNSLRRRYQRFLKAMSKK